MPGATTSKGRAGPCGTLARQGRSCPSPPTTDALAATRTPASVTASPRRVPIGLDKPTTFDPRKFKDEYETALRKLIRRKADGHTEL